MVQIKCNCEILQLKLFNAMTLLNVSSGTVYEQQINSQITVYKLVIQQVKWYNSDTFNICTQFVTKCTHITEN